MSQLDEMAGTRETCLDGIKEDLKILEESSRRVEEIKEELRLMEKSGEKAAILVQDLLSVSVTGTYERKPVDVNTVVRNFLRSPGFVDMRSSKDEMTVVTKLEDDVSQILGSESHLNRILTVLAENALETMAKKDRERQAEPDVMTISTSNVSLKKALIGHEIIDVGDYVVLKVQDSGLGIPAENRDRIFEPFFTTKAMSSSGGMGLGLSIVRGVVKDHGGFLDLDTEIGRGSTFMLYFPAVAAAVKKVEPTASLPRGREHILVVDDEPAQRYVAKRLLNELGYKVTVANNGQEAVNLVKEAKAAGNDRPFDLVMLDMIMEEGFDGLVTYELLSELCPGLKVIVASGYAATGRGKKMISRGVAWLSKPFGMRELAGVLRKELDK
jgi:CheY-like chemotaxis protein